MEDFTIVVAILIFVFLFIKYVNHTDVPKIKNLPEVPGVPVFGNLLQLGDEHPKNAAAMAKKYGPVFQTRLGNKVSQLKSSQHAQSIGC